MITDSRRGDLPRKARRLERDIDNGGLVTMASSKWVRLGRTKFARSDESPWRVSDRSFGRFPVSNIDGTGPAAVVEGRQMTVRVSRFGAGSVNLANTDCATDQRDWRCKDMIRPMCGESLASTSSSGVFLTMTWIGEPLDRWRHVSASEPRSQLMLHRGGPQEMKVVRQWWQTWVATTRSRMRRDRGT